jgi:NitT/TauT family transport system permease protein
MADCLVTRFRRALLILAPWVLIVLAWYAVRASGLINPGLIPAPHAVAAKAWELLVRDPVINFFRALPPIALIPLVIVYFGVDELAKIVILFYASFFAGVIVMYEGISQISPLYVRVARTLGATDAEIFRKVIVPLTVPHILTALRVALGVAWATLVASELIAAQQGLGALIQNASSYFLLDVIYVGIICIGLIALVMDLALRRASARLVAWQERI